MLILGWRKREGVLGTRGLHHQRIDFATKAIELDPLEPLNYAARGSANRTIGNFDQATIDFQKALEIESDNSHALNRFARLLIMVKKYKEAEELLAKAEKLSPDYHRNKITRALLHAVKGKKEEAVQSLEEGGHKNRYYKIVIYSLLGFKDEAIRLLDNRPIADLYNVDGADYLDMLHNPFFDILRDTEEFKVALEKAKEIYEQNLLKYGEVFL